MIYKTIESISSNLELLIMDYDNNSNDTILHFLELLNRSVKEVEKLEKQVNKYIKNKE